MGATAIGTGVNAPSGYAELVTKYLCNLTGIELTLAPDLIEATVDTGAYVQLSGVLKERPLKFQRFAMTFACLLPALEQVLVKSICLPCNQALP